MSQSLTKPNIYWSDLHEAEWRLVIAATDKGICFVGSQDGDVKELTKWADSRFKGGYVLKQDDVRIEPYRAQLIDYLQGKRSAFDMATDHGGTAFQQLVWTAMSDIGYGTTATYSEIARRIGKPEAVRAVGTAIGRNPALVVLPCHRIIGKNGALTGYRGGLAMKERLLSLERR
jgi:methylated-DNA-[protein]-cysteine S-methyltransferase